jgi:hypothetical protein
LNIIAIIFQEDKGMIKTGDICDCGGVLRTPEELGLNPEAIVNDGGWVWKLKEALICDTCGGHYLITENEK